MKCSKPAGFTLIEVMIVVAIVAILAAVALPAYTDYIRRGQLTQAFTQLSDYRIKMEQYFQDNRSYGTGTCASAGGTWKNFDPGVTPKFFDFSCALTSNGFTVTATGVSTTRATGYTYTVNEAGLKKTTRLKNATVDLTCWAVKSAGDCT